ncbi:hypothetical protein B0T18DRAFT_429850 [Schizothecium vesticola]|uniref:Uncharacterized protein n=1 Tax=Schizothecium vesticola TaxID=314040 RepID=A0AA40K5S5_9PEZI|nr:hypothetical protein B0T18DRAFT_429850 [Schizothecium vesticola]
MEAPAPMEAPALMEAPAPAPKRRGRPPKNKEAAVPEPKRQRATPGGGPPAATIGTTRSGRQVKLTKKAAEAGRADHAADVRRGGPTVYESPYKCTFGNDWYSKCL